MISSYLHEQQQQDRSLYLNFYYTTSFVASRSVTLLMLKATSYSQGLLALSEISQLLSSTSLN